MATFFRNKHVIVAMFVAPILAVLSWFLVDHLIGEKPHESVSGESYPLVALPNCRYESGLCTLKNGDVKLIVRVAGIESGALRYTLSSELPIDGAMITVSEPQQSPQPVVMVPTDGSSKGWRADLTPVDRELAVMRLAVNIDDSIYFAETGIDFIDYRTNFPQENFSR